MKFSEDPSKATYPAKKTVYRVWEEGKEKASFDLIALEGEQIDNKVKIFVPEKPREPIAMNYERITTLNEYWHEKAPLSKLQ